MATKDLYPSIRPSLNLDFANSKVLDPRITFGRASAATYYDGKTVAKAEENLLEYSQDFDTTWSRVNSSLAVNSGTAPDGTSTADLVYPISLTAQRSIIWQAAATLGLTYTYSIYAKASGKNWVVFQAGSGGTVSKVWWDVLNGVLGTTNGETATITGVGNGWYRLTLTRVSDGPYVVLGPCDANGSEATVASGTDGVLFWGAQLEQRSQVTAYTPTTTQPITNYVPVLQTAAANVARFDHNPVTGESLGLLIEEQRTNLLTYSEQFSNAAWTRFNSTISPNIAVAPDGTITADKIVEDTSSNSHTVARVSFFTPTAGSAYTTTIYAKAAERSMLQMTWTDGITGSCTVNLSDGSVSNGSPIVQSAGNGWWKISLTLSASGGIPSALYIAPRITSGGGSASYQGDGYSGIYIWGAQLEAGAFPTSYIKTEASQVTRAADAASMTGLNFSSWYRQDEGTFFANASTVVDVTAASSAASGRIDTIGLSDGSTANMVAIGPNAVGLNNVLTFYSASNGSPQCNTSINLAGARSYRLAAAFAANNFGLSVSGSAVSVDTSGLIAGKVDRLLIGNRLFASPTQQQNGCIKRITYYPKRLTDAQLQALTA